MFALLLVAASSATAPSFEFDVQQGVGLSVTAGGLPLIQGSGCQIYAPGWTRGYYSSTSADQTIERPDPDTVRVTFSSGAASGEMVYHRAGPTLHVDETFQWDGDDPALVEVTAAKFWAPALAVSDFTADGKPMPSLASLPNPKADMMHRRVAPDGVPLKFTGPWGSLSVAPRGAPWFVFDARGYPQEYAVGKSLLWFGLLEAPLPKGRPQHFGFDVTIQAAAAASNPPLRLEPATRALPNAEEAVDDQLPLAPNPKRPVLTRQVLKLGGPFKFPAGRFFHFDEFKQTLAHRFDFHWPIPGRQALLVDGGIHDMKLPHEAYRIEIRPSGFTVFGQDENGLRFGIRRLALLVRSHGGDLTLPIGTITDWPSTPWRGFHLFVGPQAAPFQRELLERVLLPFGFNKAVLECERTAWKSLPNVRGPEVMSLAALSELFKMYREEGIEPIPLVQSFGHMEWFFAGGANLDIAYNPKNPYGVDPRNPRTREILDRLWDEVIDVTEAKTVHFGCDEVDMVGWDPNPKLMTDLWALQMPILGDIAKKHDVSMMLWGDMALAPGEAIDATNGSTGTEAGARRRAIPRGAMIADWHYKADPKFEDFFPSLETWKTEGLTPIAACWHEPDNVYGFTVAGVQQAAGTLKTTWCSENSTAEDPIANFDEFAALVLSGEYAWSGRQDPPSDFDYDYRELFRRLYFAPPIPLKPVRGVGLAVGAGAPVSIGRYRFAPFTPIKLHSSLADTNLPADVTLNAKFTASTLVLACGCEMPGDTGAPVATVTVTLADGSSFDRVLKYGEDVRAGSDLGVVPLAEQQDGKYAALITLPKPHSAIVAIRIATANAFSGLTVYGVTGF
ncbi:MAG: glycoside hydrolase family 20 zincin-like fold domain-containing protein [Fimbriimonadaceae bacterium]